MIGSPRYTHPPLPTAAIVNRPRIFADEKTGTLAGLEKGGDRGPGTPAHTQIGMSSSTNLAYSG